MRCEVVAIGTELLLGQIVDTNSSWIGEQLAMFGINSHFQTKVGDNFDRMEFSIRQALDRSDAVICCGGLGPTQDDITRDVIAHIMGVELARDEVGAAVGLVEEVEHILKVQVHLFLSGAGALLGHAQGSDALGRGTGDEGCGGPKGESDDGGAEHSFRRELTQTTWKTW